MFYSLQTNVFFQSQICLFGVLWPWGWTPGPPAARQSTPTESHQQALTFFSLNFKNQPPALAVPSIKMGLLLISLLYVICFGITKLTKFMHCVKQRRCRRGLRLVDFNTCDCCWSLVTLANSLTGTLKQAKKAPPLPFLFWHID